MLQHGVQEHLGAVLLLDLVGVVWLIDHASLVILDDWFGTPSDHVGLSDQLPAEGRLPLLSDSARWTPGTSAVFPGGGTVATTNLFGKPACSDLPLRIV